jgi:SAM-dependent methyltransferase
MLPWFFAAAALACLALRPLVAGRTFDATPLLALLAPWNDGKFWLWRRLPFGRRAPALVHANEAKDALYTFAGKRGRALAVRERELRRRYALGPLHARSSVDVYRENVYLLDLLDRHAPPIDVPDRVRAVDVGSQDFRYAFALARWLGQGRRRSVQLTGIELEGERVQRDLRRRRDHGRAYAAEVEGATVRYEVGDFVTHEARDLDVVFLFFPFVLEYALLRWGLPRRFFGPDRLFAKVHAALRPGAVAIVMNHTLEERAAQHAILERCGFVIEKSVRVDGGLVPWGAEATERTMTVARKPQPASAIKRRRSSSGGGRPSAVSACDKASGLE